RREFLAWIDAGRPADRAPALRNRLELERSTFSYAEVLIVSPEGEPLLSTAEHSEPISPQTHAVLREAVVERHASHSNLFAGADGAVLIDTIAPILSDAGEPIAVVVMRADTRE